MDEKPRPSFQLVTCFLDKLLEKFPKGTNILHRQLHWGCVRDDWKNRAILSESIDEGSHFEVLVWGIPREPEAFILDAIKAGHPKRALARVSDQMKNVLEEVFLGDAVKVRSERAIF